MSQKTSVLTGNFQRAIVMKTLLKDFPAADVGNKR